MLEFPFHYKEPSFVAKMLRDGQVTVTMKVIVDTVLEGWYIPPEILTYFAWRVAAKAVETCTPILECHDPELLVKLRDVMNLHRGLIDKMEEDRDLRLNASLSGAKAEEPLPAVAEVSEAWGAAWNAMKNNTTIIKEGTIAGINDHVNDPVLYHLVRCVLRATGNYSICNPQESVGRVISNYICMCYEIEMAQHDEPPKDLDEQVSIREDAWLRELLADLIETYLPDGVKRTELVGKIKIKQHP